MKRSKIIENELPIILFSSEISRKLLDRVDRNRILICNEFENVERLSRIGFSRKASLREKTSLRGKYLYGVEEEEVKRGTFPEFDRVEGEESRVTPADTLVKIGTCHEIFRNLLLPWESRRCNWKTIPHFPSLSMKFYGMKNS